MKNERMAAWAAKQAAGVASQILAIPPATNWRQAKRRAEVTSLLHKRERRYRRKLVEPDFDGPF